MSHAPEPQEHNPESAMDYPEHTKTFDLFIGLLKWGTIACIVVLILMAVFLV